MTKEMGTLRAEEYTLLRRFIEDVGRALYDKHIRYSLGLSLTTKFDGVDYLGNYATAFFMCKRFPRFLPERVPFITFRIMEKEKNIRVISFSPIGRLTPAVIRTSVRRLLRNAKKGEKGLAPWHPTFYRCRVVKLREF